MKRIIYIVIAAAIVLATLGGVAAFAGYEENSLTRGGTSPIENTVQEDVSALQSEDLGETTESSLTKEVADEGKEDTEVQANGATEGTDYAPVADDAGEESDDKTADSNDSDGARNPFAALFNAVKENATEIFCSLTFIGSILLAYAYKKGLIPLLQGGISAISGTVSKIKESAERGESKTDELSRAVCDRLTDAEVCLDSIGKTLGELEGKLKEVGAYERDSQRMRLVMSAQVDMLYSIFMTSSLPQYQKDEVSERIKEMKEALLADEGE